MSEESEASQERARAPMKAATRFALAAAGLIPLVPVFGFISVAGHGFGPCGPANLAGLLGCFGFLICLPTAAILWVSALSLHARERRATFWERAKRRAQGHREPVDWRFLVGAIGAPAILLLIGLIFAMSQGVNYP